MTTSSRTTTQQPVRRYWRLRDTPSSWWPWGLLLPLGLLLLWLFGAVRTANHIEADIQQRTSEQLAQHGFRHNKVTTHGQRVIANITTATSPDIQAVEQAHARAVARVTMCSTWAGDLICPTSVELTLEQPATVDRQAAKPEQTVEPQPTVVIAQPRPHDFAFSTLTTGQGRELALRGEVPDTTSYNRLMSEARSKFDSVDDNLQVSGEPATGAWQAATQSALEFLAHTERGAATWQASTFSASALVNAEHAAASRMAFANAANDLTLGELELQIAKSVDNCNTEFRSALRNSTINFTSSSADIDPDSSELLERLAALANVCPGNLVVEGHTDSLGDPTFNKILSLARAEAVQSALVELGVAAARVNVVGYGPDQPITTNRTRAGRAQNRRIVISSFTGAGTTAGGEPTTAPDQINQIENLSGKP